MRIGKYYSLSVLLGLTLVAFGSVGDAYAVDFILSDETSCTGLPGGGESWNGTTLTCSKTRNLGISALNTLTVENGVTLAFSDGHNLINRGEINNHGTITLNDPSGNGGFILNRQSADFTNFGTITINGSSGSNGWIENRQTASFTNLGTITINGDTGNSGRLLNRQTASFANSGTITINGQNDDSGQFRNEGTASFTNTGTITIFGVNSFSGLIRNHSVLVNSGSLVTNYDFWNDNVNSALTNSGTLQILLDLDNTNGLISNNCGQITFGSFSGNPIQEESCQTSFSSNAYEDPTIGKSSSGKQIVEDGICIDETCWTVTAVYHQDFELVEMLSDSTHTISTTVFCQHGVHKCNYVAFGVSPYGTNINDSIWKVIMQKDHLDNWAMTVIDPEDYLGEVTSTTQIVNDNRFLSASATIEFIKSTPGMILNVEVRDSGGGYRDFKFNDGVAILDSYAYPEIEASYDAPLELEPLCVNANPDKRYTCAFEKTREQTLMDAQIAYEQVMSKQR